MPRNSKLILEVHYEPIGREFLDDYSHIRINFHKKKPKYELVTYVYNNQDVNIPPYKSNHKIKSSYKIKETMLLIRLNTHMHLRGKASSVFIVDPQGVRKRIFGVDPFIITFEKFYKIQKPLVVSKGSTIECINWFDNSKKNPTNPDPERFVNWGIFLKDEMSMCLLQWLVPVDQYSKHYLWKKN